jgi:hypothetical protein
MITAGDVEDPAHLRADDGADDPRRLALENYADPLRDDAEASAFVGLRRRRRSA